MVSEDRPSSEPQDADVIGIDRRGRCVKGSHRILLVSEDGIEADATLVDFSTAGCQVNAQIEVEVGMIFKLSLFLDDQPWPLRVDESIVRWVRGQTFGLEFIGIRPVQRERLRSIIMKER